MVKYLAIAKNLFTEFRVIKIEQVGRDLNSHADALSGFMLVFEDESGWIITIELISNPSLEIQ